MTHSAPYEKSKSLGSGGSMVARLKLKGSRRPSGLRKTSSMTNSLAHRTTWLRSDLGSGGVFLMTHSAPYEKSKSLGSGGSMVARLKLKGIDGRAPPGVEPAA
ncbi:unnamed protein product [Saccharomyces cerevisiae]|nr:unnamed protein product [Saccharomyces cerevisiae]